MVHWIDVPDWTNPEGDWKNVDAFNTKADAIEYCQRVFGGDDKGRVCLITEGVDEEEGEDE